MNAAQEAISHKQLSVPNDLGQDASVEITGELKALLADVFTLYIRLVRKNRGWIRARAVCQVSDRGRVRGSGTCGSHRIFS